MAREQSPSPQYDDQLKFSRQISSQEKSYSGLHFILSPASGFPYSCAEVSVGTCLERLSRFPLP
ncbi:hypothetical protein EMIT0P258_10385 [Pseudomonas sp. IT-P258]